MSSEQMLISPLWTALIDDAAVFPPGNSPVPDAVAAHSAHRNSWYATAVGPLLLPVSGVDAFLNAATDDLDIPAVALAVRPGTATVEQIAGAHEALSSRAGTRVQAVETAVAADQPQDAGAKALLSDLGAALPDDVDLWLELRSAPDTVDAMRVIADSARPAGAKYRMGGTDAAAFPGFDDVITVLAAVADTGCTLKLTAGLHNMHRFADPALDVTHHGFGNVMVALHCLLHGGEPDAARALLASDDPQGATATLTNLTSEEISALRGALASFGCCGVTDPIDDLVASGLIRRAS